MNRGLVIAADKVEYKDEPGKKVLNLVMSDPAIHGLLDGGHTYRVVIESAKVVNADTNPRYVRVEIITGFDRDTISDVVEARNTSNQVRDESLANLRQEFDAIKDVLGECRYFDEISWSEYEELETGKAKPIDIRDIISFLITFDWAAFNSTTQPLIAYKDKRACLRHFQQHKDRICKLYPLLPEILLLWDEIHDSWPVWYNVGRQQEEGIKGRFGGLTAVSKESETPLYFKGKSVPFRMPDAYKYPILSSLRAAIRVNGQGAKWSTDPFELLKDSGRQLANVVGNTIRATNNPNKVGKDVQTWCSCYLVIESALSASKKTEAEKRIKELEARVAELQRGQKK
jgi:hypothetical protein